MDQYTSYSLTQDPVVTFAVFSFLPCYAFYFVSSGIFYYLHIYAYSYGVCFLFIDLPSEYATRRDDTRDLHMMALYAVVLCF